MTDRRGTIAVDFDGVIHSYTSPWSGALIIPDPPVPGAIEWLNEMVQNFNVVIFTTRGKTSEGRRAVQRWVEEQGGPHLLEVTHEKPPAIIYLDDRAVRFTGDNFPTYWQIYRELTPWNKPKRKMPEQ